MGQTLLASVQVEGPSIIRARCDEKNAWDAEPERGTGMRMIATFSGPCASHALTSHVSVFSHDFKGLERLPKLATSSTSSWSVCGREESWHKLCFLERTKTAGTGPWQVTYSMLSGEASRTRVMANLGSQSPRSVIEATGRLRAW